MRETARELGLAQEALDGGGIRDEARADDLDRDLAPHGVLDAAIDGAHAAGAGALVNGVAIVERATEERIGSTAEVDQLGAVDLAQPPRVIRPLAGRAVKLDGRADRLHPIVTIALPEPKPAETWTGGSLPVIRR